MATKNWDPDQLTVMVALVPIEGFAEDAMVKIKKTTPRKSSKVGVTGEVVRSKSKDKRAIVTISLMQTSNSNDILSAIAIADDLAPNGAGIFPIMIRDRQGRALYSGAEAWIVDQPDPEFKGSPTVREWNIEVAELDDFTGGS